MLDSGLAENNEALIYDSLDNLMQRIVNEPRKARVDTLVVIKVV